MHEKQKAFKPPPRKYHPKGLKILYEDRDILVVDKSCSLLTVSTEKIRENTAFYLLNAYVRRGNQKSRNRVFIVHRLDRDTSGVLVFAKSEPVKRFLQDEWQTFQKIYYAVVQGHLKQKQGVLTSYLEENSIHRMYSIDDPQKGKLARTGYKVLKESPKYSLLEIDLLTGRKHQIRVHLAEQGCPVVGDRKYGERDKAVKRLGLHALSISILHPFSKEPMTFKTTVPDYFDIIMKSK